MIESSEHPARSALSVSRDRDIRRDERANCEEASGVGVDDGVRTRDFRSHSPALYH